MPRQSVVLPTAMLALATAGILSVPSARQVPPSSAAAADQAASGLGSAGVADDQSGAVEPVDLLADYLDLDISLKGIGRGVRSAATLLNSSNGIPPERLAAARLLVSFCSLDFTPLAPLRREIRALATPLQKRIDEGIVSLTDAESQRLSAFLRTYLDDVPQKAKMPEYDRERISRDLASVDLTALRRKQVRARADIDKLRIRFLIATIPDPVDSYVGWYFDPMLDAVRRGIEAQQYVMDRFYLPDWTPNRDIKRATPQAATLHERYPGLLLFRKRMRTPPPDDVQDLLMVMLVTENPTAGLHKAPFQRAVKFILDWEAAHAGAPRSVPVPPDQPPRRLRRSADQPPLKLRRSAGALAKAEAQRAKAEGGSHANPVPPYRIRVVGPTFSGSAPSLSMAIQRASRPHVRFDVVTGVATAAENRKIIEDAGASFGATILDKTTLTRYAGQFLRERVLQDQGTSRRYGLLLESNTGYGQATGAAATAEFSKPLEVRFPLHISRIRSASQQNGSPQFRPIGTPLLRPLALDDASLATDRLPAMSPALADSAAELMLTNVLQTIAADRVRVVGIVATDARDTLFLAKQLGEKTPNTLVYGLESELLYSHPEFSSWTRGMLLVSTYPLYNRNQLWSYPGDGHRRREMFYSSLAQGLFNAVTLQLAADPPRDRDGRSARLASPSAFPLEYARPLAPCGTGCTPPVWVSVVGRDRVWPVRVYVPSTASPYITPVVPSGDTNTVGGGFDAPLWAPPLVPVLAAALMLFVLMHGVAFFGVAREDAVRYFSRFARPTTTDGDSSNVANYLAACFWALLIVATYVACVFWTWLASTSLTGPWIIAIKAMGVLLSLTCLIALAFPMAWLTRALFRQQAEFSRNAQINGPAIHRMKFAVRVVIAAIGVLALYNYVRFLVDVMAGVPSGAFTESQLNAVLWYERSVNLLSGVSPAIPVVGLAGAVYLWGLEGLKRGVQPHAVCVDKRLFALDTITQHEHDTGQARRTAFARLVGCLTVLVVSMLSVNYGVLSHEGMAFSSMYFFGVLLVEVLVAGTVISVWYRWRSVTSRLCRLEEHPLVDVFKRLPHEVVTPKNLIRMPRLAQAYPFAERARQLARLGSPAVGQADIGEADTLARQPEFSGAAGAGDRERARATAVWTAFCGESGAGAKRWTASRTWRASTELIHELLDDLSPAWDTRKHAAGSARKPMHYAAIVSDVQVKLDVGPHAVSSASGERRRLQEELLALHLALTLREVFAGFANRAIFCLASVFLILLTHTLFPFQPHSTLVSLAWINVGVVVTLGMFGLLSLDRNAVICRMSGGTPGEINWSSTLVWRVLLFGVTPLLSLLAVEFPGIGTTILKWLEPVQKAL